MYSDHSIELNRERIDKYLQEVAREYLVAMKLKSGRKYKHDLSDIVGIVAEQQTLNDLLSLEEIKSAYECLYGDWNNLEESLCDFINSVLSCKDIAILFSSIKSREIKDRNMLIEFQADNPNVLKHPNVDSILELIKEKQK